MTKGRQWVLVKPYDGLPKRTDLELQEFEIPDLKDGEMLIAAEALSVDPYMRYWGSALKKGDTIMGQIVARVVKSNNPGFKAGDRVSAFTGWVSHAVVSSHTSSDFVDLLNHFPVTKIPDSLKDYPPSLSLGVLGMPGLTAYFGILRVGKLKPKDTVFVNAAAGAVGSLVGQIAKIKGCKVIGSTGSDEKVKYLTEELGFDAAFNYKVVTHDKLSETLSKLAPDGIDVFFENVGGEASSVVYKHLNKNGRVAVCGSISNYNCPEDAMPKVTEFIQHLFYKSIQIQGFVVLEFMSEFEGALKEMAGWMQEGKLKYREHVHKGFDKMFDAFMDLFAGNNIGKVVVTV